MVSDGPDKPFFDVLVKDKNTLVVIGAYNLAIQSSDGGKTWQAFSQNIENSGSMHLYALADIGGREIIAGEQGLLLAQDHGENFTPVQSPYDGSFFGLFATGKDSAVAFGLRGNAYFTGNNGKSWIRSNVHTGDTFNAGVVKKNGDVLLLTQSGRIFASRDSGENFRQLKFEVGVPLTSAVETENGDVIIASVAGVFKLAAAASREFAN
ncbi:Photosynthesis system II assembly factor YCF48 [compost metagenome]